MNAEATISLIISMISTFKNMFGEEKTEDLIARINRSIYSVKDEVKKQEEEEAKIIKHE